MPRQFLWSVVPPLAITVLLAVPDHAAAELDPSIIACPDGAKPSGGPPPEHLVQECRLGSKRHGPFRSWWPSGEAWRTGQYEHGKRTGEWRATWPNGNLAYVASYKGGLLHGPVTVHYPTGQKKLEGEYSFGRANGTFVAHAEDGELVGQLIFDAGKIRPKSKGNPKVSAFLPARSGAPLSKMEKQKASLIEAGRALKKLGQAKRPSKLEGDKAAAYDAQSEWLVQIGGQLELIVEAASLVRSDATAGIRVGTSDEAALLRRTLRSLVRGAFEASRKFRKSSASARARHAMASDVFRRLQKAAP